MKINLKLETSTFCYVYSKYKIMKINNKEYILPEKKATKKVFAITERINEILIDTLNIGKKVFFKENIEQSELLDYFAKYGSFGFMVDLAINKYFILEENVAIRDAFYITQKDTLDFINTEEYLKYFLPEIKKKEINSIIDKCKRITSDTQNEKYLTSMLNEYLIYSEHYAEPINLILNYARALYKNLISTIEDKHISIKMPFLNVNHLEHNIDDLYYNNSLGFTINYLKQAIDMAYSMQMAQDIRLLKVCNFCDKAFIANNPKAEYDTYNCKNKANVYKSRGKDRTKSRNIIYTDEGISVKLIDNI